MQNALTDFPAKLPPLPIGNSDWAEVRTGYWSADKTQLISGLLDRKATIVLFTRPRRFGKTFAIEMLKTFFERTEKSNAPLFEGTKVWQNPEHRAEQGKYPVIHMTFKDAKGDNWPQTLSKIVAVVRDEFDRHDDIFHDAKVKESARAFYRELCIEQKNPENSDRALGILATALHAFHKEKPVILIDEYDSPINYAATHGFGEEALQFFRNFLSGAMKDGKHCRLGVITGILRVAKEGVLSGLNNLEVWSVFENDYSDCFGLTEEEVKDLLATYGHLEKLDEAKDWYDGYVFGGREIYNPWSLVNYVRHDFTPKPYWANTSSNDLVRTTVANLPRQERAKIENIIENGKGSLTIAPDLGPYGTVMNRVDAAFALLVHTGYLKVLEGPTATGACTAAFPNREVEKVFIDDIVASMNAKPAGSFSRGLGEALLSGDAEVFRAALEDFVRASASFFDMAQEDFFHGLMLGLLAMTREDFEIASNREDGDGRSDIRLRPRPGRAFPGVVLELKHVKIPSRTPAAAIRAKLDAAARKALRQIGAKGYAEEMERELAERDQPLVTRHSSLVTAQDTPPRVLRYGLAFGAKRVALAK